MTQPHALIIDDNARNLSVLALLLREQGVEATPIVNPKQIDAILGAEEQVDLIFLDLELPGMSGYDVFDRLRTDERFGSVPVIAYTVHSNEIARAQQLGFDSFIGKPLDPDKFPDQLARILKGEPVWERS